MAEQTQDFIWIISTDFFPYFWRRVLEYIQII